MCTEYCLQGTTSCSHARTLRPKETLFTVGAELNPGNRIQLFTDYPPTPYPMYHRTGAKSIFASGNYMSGASRSYVVALTPNRRYGARRQESVVVRVHLELRMITEESLLRHG